MSVDLYLNICSNERVVLPKSRQIVILKLMMLFITCGGEYQLLISWSIEHPSVASMWCLDLSMDEENGEDDDLDIKDGDNNEKEEKYKEEIFATLALVGQIFLPP